ncbi:serine-rich adhesin for platelets-like isoform X2 [Dysidea avara]|uniref:serine-rich adhesin for platelets-like isoform X2 n=1 Tax=Dysidea avara TaxID=196820 RepID=UPI0033257ED4
MAVNESQVILTICSKRPGQSTSQENEDDENKIEAYRVLTSHLKQSGSNLLPQLLDKFCEIVPLALNDAGASNQELAVASLQFLGHSLFDQPLAKISQAEVIVPILCELAQQRPSIDVITHLLWCLANHKMSCSASMVTAHVKVQVMMVTQLIMTHKHSSFAVEAECLNLLHRLYKDHEAVFLSLEPMMWYPTIVTLLTGQHQKNVMATVQLARKLETLLIHNQEVASWLIDTLREKLTALLQQRFNEAKKQVTVLLVWQHFVRVLDDQLHNYGNWFNGYLKIVEQAFKHNDSQVQVAAYKAWQCLLDNYALEPRVLTGSRRIRLIMTPLIGFPSPVRHRDADMQRYCVWQHLIGCLGNKRPQCMKQVISPLLLFCVGVDTRCANMLLDEWAFNGAHVSLTPTTPPSCHTTSNDIMNVFVNIVHCHGDTTTLVSSPRLHPGLVYRSLLLSCCQLVTSLCGLSGSHISGAVAPAIKCGDGHTLFLKHPKAFFLFMEAILQLSPLVTEEVCRSVWQGVYRCVTKILTDPGILSVSQLALPLISILCIAMKTRKHLAYQMVSELCHFYHQIPFKLSSEKLTVTSSLNNKVLFPWEFLLEMILHQPVILQKIPMVTVLTLLKFAVSNCRSYLKNALSIATMLEHASPSNKEQRWLLFEVWNTFISLLAERITKLSKIAEGDLLLEKDFLFPCQLLLYPIKLLYIQDTTSSVPIEVRVKLLPTWNKLLDAVAMVLILEPNMTANEFIAMVISKLVTMLQEQQVEISLLCALGKVNMSVLERTDFSKGNHGNVVTAQLDLLKWMLSKGSQSEELLQGAITTSYLTCVTGVLVKLFSQLQRVELVFASLDQLIPPLTSFFDNLLNQSDGDRGALCSSLRKIWAAIATCLQARYTGGYSPQLLGLLSPLLVLMLSLKDRGRSAGSMSSLILTFWCATFAKEATLVYPEKLRKSLALFRRQGGRIELPGWQDDPCDDDANVTIVADSINGHQIDDSLDSEHHDIVPVKGSFSRKKLANGSDSGEEGKALASRSRYLRARRKLPLDWDNSENYVEVASATKKKRLLTEHQKECRRERRRSRDIPKMFNTLDKLSQNGHTQELSAEMMISQSEESPAVPMVITCNGIDVGSPHPPVAMDLHSPSLLSDYEDASTSKPRSSIPISQSTDAEYNSPILIASLADSSYSPKCVQDTQPIISQDCDATQASTTDGEIPSTEELIPFPKLTGKQAGEGCSSHPLQDHSYTAVQHGQVDRVKDKVLPYSSMISPVKKSETVLLSDNGLHAARCLPVSVNKCPCKAVTGTQPSDKMSQPGDKVTQSGSEVTQPRDKVTQPGDKVTQSGSEVTQPRDKVTQPEDKVTQSGGEVTQPGDKVTQSGSKVTQPGDKVTQSGREVTQLGNKVTQSGSEVTQPGDKVTQSGSEVTQPGDKVTQSGSEVTQPGDKVTQSGREVTQPGDKVTQSGSEVTQPGDKVTQSGSKVTQSGSKVTQPGDKVIQLGEKVTQPVDKMTQPAGRVTQPVNKVTQPVDTMAQHTNVMQPVDKVIYNRTEAETTRGAGHIVTQPVTHPGHTVTQAVANPGHTVTQPAAHNVQLLNSQSDCSRPPLQTVQASWLQHSCRNYSELINHITLGSLTALQHLYGNRIPLSSSQLPPLPRLVQPSNHHVTNMLNMLSSVPPPLTAAPASARLPSQRLPLVPAIVRRNNYMHSNNSSSQRLISAGVNNREMHSTNQHITVNTTSPICTATPSNTTSPICTATPSNTTSPICTATPLTLTTSSTNSRIRITLLASANTVSTTSSSITSVTPTNTSLPSANTSLPSANTVSTTSLTPANSSSVTSANTSLPSANTVSATSLTPVNSSSVTSANTSLPSANTVSATSLTPVNSSSVTSANTSLPSANTVSTTSLTPVNSSSVTSANTSLPSANTVSATSLTPVNSSSVTSANTSLPSANTVSTTSLTPVNSSSVTSANTSLPSTNTVSATSLTPVNSSSVTSANTSLPSANTVSATSLTPVNSSSVTSANTSLPSANTVSTTSLTPVNSSSVTSANTSLPSTNTVSNTTAYSVTSLTMANTSGVTSISSANISLPEPSGDPVLNNTILVNTSTQVNASSASLPSVSVSLPPINSSSASLTPINTSGTSLPPVNSLLAMSSTLSVNNVSVNTLLASNDTSMTSVTTFSTSADTLTPVNNLTSLTPTMASIPSIALLTSGNTANPVLTPVNSSSVTSNSISLPLMNILSSNTSVNTLTPVNISSSSLTPVNISSSSLTPVNISSSSLTPVNTSSVAPLALANTLPPSTELTPENMISTSANTSSFTGNTSLTSASVPTVGAVLNGKCDNDAAEDDSKSCDLNVSHDLIKESGDVNTSPPHTPTSGILKRISQFDTPSTSGKRRRVSFAESVEEHRSNDDMPGESRFFTSPRSKLHSKASPRRLLSKLNKSRSDKKALCKMQATKSAAATEPRPLARQVYPALTSCDAPVEEILHGLMSSPTARGLGQLLHARNIRTVGNLAALTETQIKSLPIKQPKLRTLHNTMELFDKQISSSPAPTPTSPSLVSGHSNVTDRPLPKEQQSESMAYSEQPSKDTTVREAIEMTCGGGLVDIGGEHALPITEGNNVPSIPGAPNVTQPVDDVDTTLPTSIGQSNSSSESNQEVGAPPTDKIQSGSSSDNNKEVEALPAKGNQSDCSSDNNQEVESSPIQITQSDCSNNQLQEMEAPPTDIGQSDCSDILIAEHDPSDMDVNKKIPFTSGCGPQQPVSDRMHYLTESCSYGDSDDYLTLATPDSQIASRDVIISDTCHDEDPLAIISDEGRSIAISDEGDSLANTGNPIHQAPVVSQVRQKLHDCLQKKGATEYPNILSKVNDIIDDLKSHSNSECDDIMMIIYDALDYHQISRN